MKYISAYKEKLNCKDGEEVFAHLLATLKPTIKSWDYFVNWAKVLQNYSKIEYELNLLNSLIGKENIEQEALKLFAKYPDTIKAIPILLVCREMELSLLSDYKQGFQYQNFAFAQAMESENAVLFMKSSGLLKLFEDKIIKSIPDYVIGVEAGLDSNGRKNRSGTSMEAIVAFFVSELCVKEGWEWIPQATKKKIADKWGKNITVEKSDRQIDFAILANNKLFLIEANFYGGGGSKLKSTAGEYKSDFRRWKADGHQFIWVTDGEGWKSTHKPLRETFDETDSILNLGMLEKGMLEQLLKNP
ncbi:MAG: type II restriction endonuclease [Alphaproteobacteria bacterium]